MDESAELSYSPKCDVWSIGIILHNLLTGRDIKDLSSIYEADNKADQVWLLKMKVLGWEINIDYDWIEQQYSEEVVDFLKQIFQKETDRPFARDLINHKWITNYAIENWQAVSIIEKNLLNSSKDATLDNIVN